MRILLLSTGGRPLFRHARDELREFLVGCHHVGFVTAASIHDEAAYFARAEAFFQKIGKTAAHVRWQRPPRYLGNLHAIVVGGGNTFALLDRLYHNTLFADIQMLVRNGMPYVGASAGANVAGLTIRTTNDWNVVGMMGFSALGLVPWNINPHYPMTPSQQHGGTQFGETRDERIAEFHRVNRSSVVGLEEPAMIRVEGGVATVLGEGRVRFFARGMPPIWFSPGDRIPLRRRAH